MCNYIYKLVNIPNLYDLHFLKFREAGALTATPGA